MMLTVGAFLSYAIPDNMRIGVYEESSDKYDGLYDVLSCDAKFGNRRLISFDIMSGYLLIELEEETDEGITV